MKKSILLLAICCALQTVCAAQIRITGIYRTPADFVHGKLSFPAARHPRLVIRANNDFYLPYITVVNGGKKMRYSKDSVFGYRTSDGGTYRFYDAGTYELLNPAGLPLLYRSAVMPGGRGARPVYYYYFSEDAAAPVMPLTRDDLRRAFERDTVFTDQVYELFRNDDDLTQYDDLHHSYRLNRLYSRLHP